MSNSASTKVCKTCKTEKPEDAFAIARSRQDPSLIYRRGSCKACRRAGEIDGHLLRRYGMNLASKNAMLVDQGGCAICGGNDPKHALGWATDHCHESNEVRGILCQPDNLAIGAIWALHQAGTLETALRYLGIPMVYSETPVDQEI